MLLKINEAAARLNVAEKTMRTWIARRKIAAVHLSKRCVRIREESVDALVNKFTTDALIPGVS